MRRTSQLREALNKLNNLDEDRRHRLLDEDLKGYFKNQYLNKFVQAVGLEGDENRVNREALKMAAAIACIDPTFKGDSANTEDCLNKNQGSYFDWLVRLINKGVLSYEQMMGEAQELTDRLNMFNELKKRNKLPSNKRDIMQFKHPDDLQDLLTSLGGDISDSSEHGTSFKGAIKNIRGALIAICGFRDEDIPQEIQHTEDALSLLCENGKWEVWRINSIWGAMLADTFGIDAGAGATWCTGGQYGFVGQPRKGQELYRSASTHYPNYTRNGSYLVAFIQKDTNVRRPYNAAQLNVDSDNYGISSFYHSNDRAIGLTGDGKLNYTGSGWGHSTSEVFSVFLQEEGLLEPLKKTVLGKCEAIADAENKERLENGEPYIYVGGKIKDIFKSSIRQIKFTYEGKEYTVSVDNADSPFLKVNSVNEMFNVKEISEGKPYTFDGQQRIPDYLKGAIREINFSEDYNFSGKRCFQSVEEDELGIPSMAFANCSALERVNLPATITVFGIKCFYNVPEDCIIVTPRFPDRRIRCMPSERADIVKRIRFEDNTRAFKDEDSKSEEEK